MEKDNTTTTLSNTEKDYIRSLWRDPNFSAAFSGLTNFQIALHSIKGIDISRSDLFKVMQTDQDFILETKKRLKKFERRHLVVHGFANIWQADVADMPPFREFKGFLLCIDLFSRNIYCRLLKTKKVKEVRQKFVQIFQEVGIKPQKLETDRGPEFMGGKSFFASKKILLKPKVGQNKASFAEHGIQV